MRQVSFKTKATTSSLANANGVKQSPESAKVNDLLPKASLKAGVAAFAATALGIIICSIIVGGDDGVGVGLALILFPIISAIICCFCSAGIWLANPSSKRQAFLERRLLIASLIANFLPWMLGAVIPALSVLAYFLAFAGAPVCMICIAVLTPERG